MLTTRQLRRISTVTIVICAVESLTKGWISFFLVPGLLAAVPLYLLVLRFAKRYKGPRSQLLMNTCLVLSISLAVFYVTMPGVGDTNQVLLYGFYAAYSGDAAVTFTVLLCYIAFWVILASFITATVLLLKDRSARAKKTK